MPRELREHVGPLVLAIFAATSVPATADETSELRVEGLSPSAYAVLQPAENRFNDSNTLFVIRENGLLVVDTQASLTATRAVIAEIRSRTQLPVRHLVLTHWHGDHVQGIAAYREVWPDVEVVGHASLRVDIPERAQPQLEGDIELYRGAIVEARDRLERRVSREGEALDDAGVEELKGAIGRAEILLAGLEAQPRPLAIPDLTYSRELEVGGQVRLLHRRAHTRGDTLVLVADAGILATGDVLDDLPFGGHGYPREWLLVLEELIELDFEIVVPGHGQVRRGKDHLIRVRDLYASIVVQVDSAVERGLDLEATQEAVELEGFKEVLAGDDPIAQRAWDNFVPATVERAWYEARGELPD